jgi:hypothetical protein
MVFLMVGTFPHEAVRKATMVEPRNAKCFEEPHWLVIARGKEVERWFEDNQVVGTGGILMPQPVHLAIGQRYYRFASSTSSEAAQAGGGWWIEYASFKAIESFAHSHGYTLSDSARLFLALPYAWSRVDRLVSAFLHVPLKAYRGYGSTAAGSGEGKDKGTRWTPLQHQRVAQLYIPGLYIEGRRPQLYKQAFPNPTIEYIMGNRRTV